jgi:hypothetical protein
MCDQCDIAGIVDGMMLSEYHVPCYPFFISPKLIPVLDVCNTTYAWVRLRSLDHVSLVSPRANPVVVVPTGLVNMNRERGRGEQRTLKPSTRRSRRSFGKYERSILKCGAL